MAFYLPSARNLLQIATKFSFQDAIQDSRYIGAGNVKWQWMPAPLGLLFMKEEELRLINHHPGCTFQPRPGTALYVASVDRCSRLNQLHRPGPASLHRIM
jgi:hypothetical protein